MAVAELRSCATALQLLVWSSLHRFSVRLLPGPLFHSLVSLQAAINRFVAEANDNPVPFRWTKDPDAIIAAVKRGHQALDSIH